MADIAATDITYTVNQSHIAANSKRRVNATLAFGNSTLTYPAGGIPITIGNLGCPTTIESLTIYDSGTSGYKWTYDTTNAKLVGFYDPARTHTHDILLKNAAVADGAGARVNAGANLLGANTGGDLTVTGSGANGGVVSTTLAATTFTQLSTVAIVATTLKVEIIGY